MGFYRGKIVANFRCFLPEFYLISTRAGIQNAVAVALKAFKSYQSYKT